MTEPPTLHMGRYRVIAVLGRSHYAEVFEADYTNPGDRVAVKVLTLSGTAREIAQTLFRKEVGALDGFAHPAVVRKLSFNPRPRKGIRREIGIRVTDAAVVAQIKKRVFAVLGGR